MKITKNSIIKLTNGDKYLIVTGETLEDITFCLVSTLEPPIEMKVVELIKKQDKPIIQPYTGGDYKYILKRLLEKANKEKY